MSGDTARSGTGGGLTRRQLLQASALGVGLVGASSLLAACGGSSSGVAKASSTSAGAPVRGGTLNLGVSGGASSDTLDPQNWATSPDQLRIQQLFDPLVWMDNTGKPELRLAKSIVPNAAGTEWTITLIDGVTTHAGKAFTAQDVLYSLQRIVTNKFPGASVIGPVDLAGSKVVNSTTLLLAYKKPFGALVDALSFPFFYMVPQGFDPKKPDGTGPFAFQSFSPGVSSTFVRNPNYWDAGKPYLDRIVTTDVADESTQVNGLQSGQFNVINQLSASSLAALKAVSGITSVVNKSGNWVPFTQNCSVQPFSDVRVRQAMRLIVDRQQMLNQVFAGNGALGNDVFSPYDPAYPTDLPQRAQDIGQAKSLLKSAGYADLSVTMYAPPAASGEISMAEVFVTQAKSAGVNVKLSQQTVGDFYSKYYQKVPFAMDYGPNQLYLPNAGQLMVGSQSFFNANHFDDAEYNAAYANAIGSTDAAKRAQYIQDMAHIDYERGAYIVPLFTPVIEAYSSKVNGISMSITGVSPGNADFKNVWMS